MVDGRKIVAHSYIWLILLLLYAPIFLVIFFSFTNANSLQWTGFSMELYERLFVTNTAIRQAILNTLIIAIVASIISTMLGTITAVGINAMRKTPRAIMLGVNQIPIINADIVVGISLMLLFVTIGLPEGYLTIILAHTVICTPYVILSVLPRLMQLDPNVYNAALDLGATPALAMRKIIMPQLKSGIRNGFLLAFTLSLDDFVITKFNNGGVDTISTYIYNRLRVKGLDPTFRALSTIIFVVVLITLIIFNFSSAKNKKNPKKILNLQ